MIPQYCIALGGTHKIKKVLDFLESQKGVMDAITKKYQDKDYVI